MNDQDRRSYTRVHVRERLLAQLQSRRPQLDAGDAENIVGECSRRIHGTYLLTDLSDKQAAELERYIQDGVLDRATLRRR